MTTVLLHGFWGQSSDWNPVLHLLPLQQNIIIIDLYQDATLGPSAPLADWPKRFWQWIDHTLAERKINVVGYSMGARLALHAIVNAPERIERALLISGQVVLPPQRHQERLQWEQAWAKRFQNDEWSLLQRAWEEQEVFSHSVSVARRHADSLRQSLPLSLLNWSPRLHSVSWQQVGELSRHIHWMFGALDQNYRLVAKSLQELPVQGQITIIPGVGHRVIEAAPATISEWITDGQTVDSSSR